MTDSDKLYTVKMHYVKQVDAVSYDHTNELSEATAVEVYLQIEPVNPRDEPCDTEHEKLFQFVEDGAFIPTVTIDAMSYAMELSDEFNCTIEVY